MKTIYERTTTKKANWFLWVVLIACAIGALWAISELGLVGELQQPAPQEEPTIETAVGGRRGSQYPNGLVAGRFGSITANTKGILIASEEFTNGSSTEGWIDGIIAAGTNQTCIANGLDAGIWIDYADMGYRFGEVSSTSLKMQMLHNAASSVAASNDFGTLSVNASSSILALTTYATSSTATTTSIISQVLRGQGVGTPVFVVPGEFVCVYLQAAEPNLQVEIGLGGGATSSDRGVDPFFHFKYHRD